MKLNRFQFLNLLGLYLSINAIPTILPSSKTTLSESGRRNTITLAKRVNLFPDGNLPPVTQNIRSHILHIISRGKEENSGVGNIDSIERDDDGSSTGAGIYLNSHLLSTKTNHILATLPVKGWEEGLMGCTVIISYNFDYIYVSHLWEEPGFMYDPKKGYDDDDLVPNKAGFESGVLKVLRGEKRFDEAKFGPGNILAKDKSGEYKLKGAKTVIFTPAQVDEKNKHKFIDKPEFNDEIEKVSKVVEKLEGRIRIKNYKRALQTPEKLGLVPVRLTIEYSSKTRQLRALYDDDHEVFHEMKGYVLLNTNIPEVWGATSQGGSSAA